VKKQTIALLASIAALLAAGCTDRYQVEGVVLRNMPERGEVTVSHAAIPGYMDAMVMPFTVRDPAMLADVAAGDRIEFDLVVSATQSVIDRLAIVSAARTDTGLLRTPAVPMLVPIGQPFPDFALVDQRGRPFTLSSLKGQVVLVTFIYTRCPLPDYCPLLMANLAQIKKAFAATLGREVSLVTITFDPKYDTSEVLSTYGAHYGAEGDGWYLLTGTTEQIQRVTAQFGVEFYPEEGMITHTLQTTVIDPEGRLFAALEGKKYSIRQLADVVRAAQKERRPSP
jgi:protein SCO1